ncbi:cilia- and flagella-associated protein 53-like [Zophobas morio]|uniref:cilia- and flagella-associated protein 53-like n=1 Tax=Zophobas morio TaxID=2755281 RepID=UPI00308272B0
MDVPNHARRPIRRSKGPTVDVLLPSVKPGAYGHFEKIRDTTELLRLFHRQHMRGFRDLERDETALNRQTEKIIRDKKCKEQRTFAAKVKDRFHEKMQAYEDAVEKRREKLRQLLCSEERQYVRAWPTSIKIMACPKECQRYITCCHLLIIQKRQKNY